MMPLLPLLVAVAASAAVLLLLQRSGRKKDSRGRPSGSSSHALALSWRRSRA